MKKLIVLLAVILLWSCNSDDDNSQDLCGDSIITNAALYQQDSPSTFDIIDAEITEDCIAITIVASGCDMSTWKADLITDGLQTDAIPPGRLIRFDFTNEELCEAAFTRIYEFYLGSETQTVIYSLDGWQGELIHNE